MSNDQTRREFILVSAGVAATFAGGTILAASGSRPIRSTALRVRRSALTPAGLADIDKYRQGVDKMKKLPASDPRNWTFQANMHGVPSGQGNNPAWAQCQHGTAYFLPWHRWYVYYFEDIIRELIGDDTFALPFWPYQADTATSDNSATRVMPAPFRTPSTASNPLYVSERDPDVNAGKPFASSDAYSAGSMSLPNFLNPPPPAFGGFAVGPSHGSSRFGGLENNPHNNVHMAVGGYQALGWMTDPDLAARDPIFWLHHSNIDRFWFRWNAMGNKNPSKSVPGFDLAHTFAYFDRHGKPATGAVAACYSTEDLGYTFEELPGEAHPEVLMMAGLNQEGARSPEGFLIAASPPPIKLSGRRVDVAVLVSDPAPPQIESLVAGRHTGRVVLTIEGVKVDRQPRAGFEVYINLPREQDAPEAAKSPHYVGNLSFFGVKGPAGHHGAGEGVDFAFDVTQLLGTLGKNKLLTPKDFTVSLVPYTSGRKPGEAVEVGASVLFTRATIRVY